MKKEFVKYEQAIALKELGFDEPCFGWFRSTLIPSNFTEFFLETEFGMNESPSDWVNSNFLDKACSAPLYQQAFRWFREKYNIQGYIYSSTVRGNTEKTKQFTGYIWNINGIDTPFLSTDARDELHDTYEEAESACLDKLIEIVRERL